MPRRGLRGGRHVGLTCPLDNGCAQPGCCVRFPGFGPGTGEVGARPTLTRNCERLCGTLPHSASQATCRCPPGHRCSQTERRPTVDRTRPSWKGASEDDPMSHVRRAVACVRHADGRLSRSRCLSSTAARARPIPRRGDRRRRGRVAEDPAAVRRRLRGRACSRASRRATPRSRSPRTRRPARRGAPPRRSPRSAPCTSADTPAGATPLDALDAFGATVTTAGAAAKTIVLSAVAAGPRPVGVRSRRRRHPGEPRRAPRLRLRRRHRLVRARVQRHALRRARRRSSCAARRRPPRLAAIRAAQQANGGWNFIGDPTGTDVDPDTTALAVEALVAGGADASDPAVHARARLLRRQPAGQRCVAVVRHRRPELHVVAILAITAAGFDVDSLVLARHGRPGYGGQRVREPDARGCVLSSSPRRRPTRVASRARTTASA